MANEPFTGLCVGGPYAGKMMSWPSRSFHIEEHLPDGSEPIKRTHYTHHHAGGPLALWIVEGWDITKALLAMAEAYVEVQTNAGK